jgi:hypothetical protein
VLWYVWHSVVMVVIRQTYCYIVISVVMRKTYCNNIENNMSYISQHWQQYTLRIATLARIILTYHNTINNMSYVSQHWQQHVLRFTTFTTICLTYHNSDNNMSYVSQHTQEILLSVLCQVWDMVVGVALRRTYCCQFCDT